MTTLDATYRELHTNDGWQPDPVQDRVVARLSDVLQNLDRFNGKGDGLLSRLFGTKKNISAERALFVGRRWAWQVGLDGSFL